MSSGNVPCHQAPAHCTYGLCQIRCPFAVDPPALQCFAETSRMTLEADVVSIEMNAVLKEWRNWGSKVEGSFCADTAGFSWLLSKWWRTDEVMGYSLLLLIHSSCTIKGLLLLKRFLLLHHSHHSHSFPIDHLRSESSIVSYSFYVWCVNRSSISQL